MNVPTRKPRVEVVIIHWRRPGNLPLILAAFRSQSIPCRLTVCDVSAGQSPVSGQAVALADEVYSWKQNHGSFNRYIPGIGYDCEFCWFHDDDMIPGPNLLEFMLAHSHLDFSVLGQMGRWIDGHRYRHVHPGDAPKPVSILCRGYWVRTRDLLHLHHFLVSQDRSRWIRHDDILLCCSLRLATGKPVLLCARPEPDQSMSCKNLPDHGRLSGAPDHAPSRITFYDNFRRQSKMNQHRIFVVNAPPPRFRNLGDHAQLWGLLEWLRVFAPGHKVIMLDKDQNKLSGKFQIHSGDLVLCHPGGNLGDRGAFTEGGRRHFIERYKSTVTVVLPQTIYFSDTKKGRAARAKSGKIYGNHPHLKIFARDDVSLEFARNFFTEASLIGIGPDFALMLDGHIVRQTRFQTGRRILLCLRDDNEAWVDKAEVHRNIPGVATVAETETLSTVAVSEGIREWMVRHKIEEFSHASVIITDRLHGVIFSYLARRPCVVLPNVDHKVAATTTTWFSTIPWIQCISSPAELPSALHYIETFEGQELQGLDFGALFQQLADQVFAGNPTYEQSKHRPTS